MNILVVEDRGSVSHYIVEALKMEGHNVLYASNIYRAKELWRNEKVECIIADLNMRPEGLKPEEIDDTMAGMLTGWVWLVNYVFNDRPEMKERTIIYSDYIDELEKNIKGDAMRGILPISKSEPSVSLPKILEYVNKISK